MPAAIKTKIGFIGNSAPSSPHHESFKAFIPKDIDFTFVQEAGAKTSLYDARGKVDSLIGQVKDLAQQHHWDGVIISGAPKEALNPGMWESVSAELKVPVCLALRSSVAALKAYSAKRILLMTPVDDQLKKLYRDYLAQFGIEAVYPPQTLRAHSDAEKLTSSDVEAMTKSALAQHPDVDAIYFQGALLDPLPILDKLEAELKLPIVASNPAMLWLIFPSLGCVTRSAGTANSCRRGPPSPPGPSDTARNYACELSDSPTATTTGRRSSTASKRWPASTTASKFKSFKSRAGRNSRRRCSTIHAMSSSNTSSTCTPRRPAASKSRSFARRRFTAGSNSWYQRTFLALWDLHWLKELDDEGYIDDLVTRLSSRTQRL